MQNKNIELHEATKDCDEHKVYQVILVDIWNNYYELGFYNKLDDSNLINEINGYITKDEYKIRPGEIKEYASTLGYCFDTTLYDIISSRYGDDEADVDDVDDYDDELSMQIRGFIFDKKELLMEINKLQEV